MKYKKCAFLFIAIVLIVWTALYIKMQVNVKEPIVTKYKQGETFKYFGLEITPNDLELYDYNEFKAKYGEPDKNYSDENNDRYVVVNLHVKNTIGKDIIVKDTISSWMMGIDNYSNGQSYDLLWEKNENPYKKNADVDLKLFYRFVDGENYKGDLKSIKESTIRVYMSFYPEERFIQY
jgi:hypothetical protein